MSQFIVKDSFLKDKGIRELYFDIYGDTVIIRDGRSKEYIGYLRTGASQVIVTLSSRYKTRFTVTLQSSERLSVIIYGYRYDSDSLGEFLADHDYFLQQPYDFDSSTIYYNPQYLVRPGYEFEASWDNRLPDSIHLSSLSQIAKSKVSQILDSATGPTSFSEAQISHKLKTNLLS